MFPKPAAAKFKVHELTLVTGIRLFMLPLCLGSLLLMSAVTSWAVEIPKNLSTSDQSQVIRILGVSSSSKFLDDPYPLGGYSGLEVSVSMDVIDTEDLSRLGDKTSLQPQLKYPRITIGKGLYYDLDLFLHFIPNSQHSNLSGWGGLLKWSFYQAKYFPLNLSLLLHANNIDVSDVFTDRNVGGELMAGIDAGDFSLFFGAGSIESEGSFLATGPDAVVAAADTPTGTVTSRTRETHSFVGVSWKLGTLFFAAELDRYRDPAYSVKTGLRF